MNETLELLIPIIAIILGCSIPLLAIFLNYRKRREMFSLYHQERMAAIEHGIELPPLPEEFFQDEKSAKEESHFRSPHHNLGWGLFWTLCGIALLAALYFNGKGAGSLYALIPVAVGIHYLIYYFVIKGKATSVAE